MNHLAPEILCQLINKLKSRIRTRGAVSGNCRTAKRKTTFGQSSFVAIGTKLWNTLPSEIKTLTELKVFNTQLKQWLKLNKPCEHWLARTWARAHAHALIVVLVFVFMSPVYDIFCIFIHVLLLLKAWPGTGVAN